MIKMGKYFTFSSKSRSFQSSAHNRNLFDLWLLNIWVDHLLSIKPIRVIITMPGDNDLFRIVPGHKSPIVALFLSDYVSKSTVHRVVSCTISAPIAGLDTPIFLQR